MGTKGLVNEGNEFMFGALMLLSRVRGVLVRGGTIGLGDRGGVVGGVLKTSPSSKCAWAAGCFFRDDIDPSPAMLGASCTGTLHSKDSI